MFQKIGLKAKVDLFVGYIDRVTIYEAKAGKTKALDLYQLRMYVDGCALDNKPVDEAVLIAKRHSAEVKELRDLLNTLTAPDGRPLQLPAGYMGRGGHCDPPERVRTAGGNVCNHCTRFQRKVRYECKRADPEPSCGGHRRCAD